MKLPLFHITIALGLGLAFSSKTPWDKPPEAWTAADTDALLSNSPWAFTTGAYMEDPYDAHEEQPAGPPDTGQNLPGERRQSWDGGPGRNRKGHLTTVPVLVRWESARPVRLAEKQAGVPEAEAQQSYIVSIAGLVPRGVYHASTDPKPAQGSGGFDAHDPEEVKEAFMLYSKIVRHGGADLAPENVKFDESSGLIRIYFPRKAALDPEEKEVSFETRFGKLNVKAKFRISSMKYQGKNEL